MPPLISYYIVAYNAERWISEAVTSIYEQGFTDFEIVIVDDASTDGTASAVKPFLQDPRIRYSCFSSNRGVGVSFPAALYQCRGEFFCALDADDALEPAHTRIALEVLNRYPEAAVFNSKLLTIDETGNRTSHSDKAPCSPFLPEYISGREALSASLQHNIGAGPGSISRGSITRQILPLFRAGWRFSNDWIFWILHFATGFGLASSNERTVRYRVHPNSISRRDDFEVIRAAEIRLSALAGLRYSMPYSRDASTLWQEYAVPLYALWLLRATKWYLRGKLPFEYVHLARSLYYLGSPKTMPFPLEVLLHLPVIALAYYRERISARTQIFPCSGLRQVCHPAFSAALNSK